MTTSNRDLREWWWYDKVALDKKAARVILVSFVLRVALAIPFLYAAIASLLQPESWVGFLPQWVSTLLPVEFTLTLFAFYELALGVWLLSRRKTFLASSVAALTLSAIILTNLGALEIVFRDVGLLLVAVALAALHAE